MTTRYWEIIKISI